MSRLERERRRGREVRMLMYCMRLGLSDEIQGGMGSRRFDD